MLKLASQLAYCGNIVKIYICHGRKTNNAVNSSKSICKTTCFSLNTFESNTINNQTGKTIKAGNHLDKIAIPVLIPAKTVYFVLRFLNKKNAEENCQLDEKQKKYINMICCYSPTS